MVFDHPHFAIPETDGHFALARRARRRVSPERMARADRRERQADRRRSGQNDPNRIRAAGGDPIMARSAPPRFVVRTTVATLIMVAGVLTAVFVGFTFDVRERVHRPVMDKLEGGTAHALGARTAARARARRAGRDARRESDAQGRRRYLSSRNRIGQRGVPSRDAGDGRSRAGETCGAHRAGCARGDRRVRDRPCRCRAAQRRLANAGARARAR